jgi:hypothetical protein
MERTHRRHRRASFLPARANAVHLRTQPLPPMRWNRPVRLLRKVSQPASLRRPNAAQPSRTSRRRALPRNRRRISRPLSHRHGSMALMMLMPHTPLRQRPVFSRRTLRTPQNHSLRHRTPHARRAAPPVRRAGPDRQRSQCPSARNRAVPNHTVPNLTTQGSETTLRYAMPHHMAPENLGHRARHSLVRPALGIAVCVVCSSPWQ